MSLPPIEQPSGWRPPKPITLPDGWHAVTDGAVQAGDRVVLLGESQVFDALPAYYGVSVVYFRVVMRPIPSGDTEEFVDEVVIAPDARTHVDRGDQ